MKVSADVHENPGDASFTVRFSEPIEPHLDRLGETPLPPYIHERSSDPQRYQTVYARVAGSAAAPTAGLHFTPRLLDQIRGMGVRVAFVTLHVGLDTFKPIDEDTVEGHKIHSEWRECHRPRPTRSTRRVSAAAASSPWARRARGCLRVHRFTGSQVRGSNLRNLSPASPRSTSPPAINGTSWTR